LARSSGAAFQLKSTAVPLVCYGNVAANVFALSTKRLSNVRTNTVVERAEIRSFGIKAEADVMRD
jgi:hypothetical protein